MVGWKSCMIGKIELTTGQTKKMDKIQGNGSGWLFYEMGIKAGRVRETSRGK